MEPTAVLADPTFLEILRELPRPGATSRPPSSAPTAGQKQVRLTKSAQANLASAYVDGHTLERLAEVFGVHRTTVIAVLERHDVPRRYQKLTTEILQEAAELYAQGWSLKQVGHSLEVDASTIQRAFKRKGIARRNSTGQ